ncbi:MAG: cytochrome c-type biogenesis protein [Woeseia sp.]
MRRLVYPVVNNRPFSRATLMTGKGGWQGAATSNSTAIARSRNAARREKGAARMVDYLRRGALGSLCTSPDSSTVGARHCGRSAQPSASAVVARNGGLLQRPCRDVCRASLVSVLLLLIAPFALAIDAGRAFDDPQLQARYEEIISEVRCLQCQNESLKDSNAFLAVDLRREIRRMLTEGKSDAEIYDFLVQRYGEFALYRPRMSGTTMLLWLAPLLLLGTGAVVAVKVVRDRMAQPIDDADDDADDGVKVRTANRS